jgi:NADH:ubiquinone oxidoreductase subunit 4 (subunit M)
MFLISAILLVPLLGVLVLLFVPSWKIQLIRRIALNTSLLTFLMSLLLWIEFDSSTARFQFLETGPNGHFSFSSLNFFFGVDGISLFLLF